MEITNIPPDVFDDVILAGVTLSSLAGFIIWAVDRILNRFDKDIPDHSYPQYTVVVSSVLLVLLIAASQVGLPLLSSEGGLWKFLVALAALMGYRFNANRV